MQRLIDANALKENLHKDPLYPLVGNYGIDGVIDAQPTIEVKPDPELEYRKAKTPFFMTHRYIDEGTKKEGTWVSTHCPTCFWNKKVGLWDSMIDRGTAFCRRCGQKIEWEAERETD